jgi:hypothetical protein
MVGHEVSANGLYDDGKALERRLSMQTQPPPSGGSGTLILAGLIVVGMGAAGYFIFSQPLGSGSAESQGYVEVQRVVPLTEGEVVVRAQEGVEVGVFAASLEAEKKLGTRPKNNNRVDRNAEQVVEIDNIGAQGGQPQKVRNPGAIERKVKKKAAELSDEDKEIRRLRKLKNDMYQKEMKRAQETAEENAW